MEPELNLPIGSTVIKRSGKKFPNGSQYAVIKEYGISPITDKPTYLLEDCDSFIEQKSVLKVPTEFTGRLIRRVRSKVVEELESFETLQDITPLVVYNGGMCQIPKTIALWDKMIEQIN